MQLDIREKQRMFMNWMTGLPLKFKDDVTERTGYLIQGQIPLALPWRAQEKPVCV